MKQRLFAILIFFLCGQFLCCSGNEGSDPNVQSLQSDKDNYNMIGEPLRSASSVTIKDIQADLKYLGFDPGPIDGTYGIQTKRAIKRFQMEHGIYADGAAGPLTEATIRKAISARSTLQNNTPQSLK